MKGLLYFLALVFSLNSFALKVGEKATDFTLDAASGSKVSLKNYAGKIVVLEWLNHGCPFVRKHYDSGNMQKMQETYTKKGVIWLSIISSAKGNQGYVDAQGAKKDKEANKSFATDILLDPKGETGHAYVSKNTPQIYIIDAKGYLAYQGAVDNKASTNVEDIKDARNYVATALDQLIAGKPVLISSSPSYGCSVKY